MAPGESLSHITRFYSQNQTMRRCRCSSLAPKATLVSFSPNSTPCKRTREWWISYVMVDAAALGSSQTDRCHGDLSNARW